MTLEKILEGEFKNLEFKVQRPKDSTKEQGSSGSIVRTFMSCHRTAYVRSSLMQ